jgi:muramoyltetrapeptide carboxypeptidase
MIQSTLATPLEIPFSRSILFLEEVNEPRYRLDRLFAHLALAGVFTKVRAVILGEFLNLQGKPQPRTWLKKMVGRYVPKGKPVLAGLPIGHREHEIWLPIGGRCSLEAGGRRLVLSPLVQERA